MVAEIAETIIKTFKSGNRIFVCGNGGSAAMSNHFAAELVNKFLFDRKPLSAISLSADNAVLTSISNDYDFKQVFARQLEAHGTQGDLLITMTTSGTSPNILAVREKARGMGINVVNFPTNKETKKTTAETQEEHLHLIHEISRIVEEAFK